MEIDTRHNQPDRKRHSFLPLHLHLVRPWGRDDLEAVDNRRSHRHPLPCAVWLYSADADLCENQLGLSDFEMSDNGLIIACPQDHAPATVKKKKRNSVGFDIKLCSNCPKLSILVEEIKR